ncbi:hypothetical protein GS836_24935 [Rhodococcus hoagii]|nr:hypothetical protein [Prescottella equi]
MVDGRARHGPCSVCRSREYGGMGGDYFALCSRSRNSARSTSPSRSPSRPVSRWVRCRVYRFANEEQKQEWLPQLTSGKALAAFVSPSPAPARATPAATHQGPNSSTASG